jgi:predicted hydrocarbon binding protein
MSEQPEGPRRLVRILLPAMQEVVGTEGCRSVFAAAGLPFHAPGDAVDHPAIPSRTFVRSFQLETAASDAVSRLLQSLEQVYSPLAGQGLARRIGRACFQYGLRAYGDGLGFTSNSFRLLPLPSKLKRFAGALAEFLNGPMHQEIRIEESDGSLLWSMGRCPLCRERQATEPVCQLAVGLAEESLYWLSGGKIFSVEEIACAARGDSACALQVNETPLS